MINVNKMLICSGWWNCNVEYEKSFKSGPDSERTEIIYKYMQFIQHHHHIQAHHTFFLKRKSPSNGAENRSFRYPKSCGPYTNVSIPLLIDVHRPLMILRLESMPNIVAALDPISFRFCKLFNRFVCIFLLSAFE